MPGRDHFEQELAPYLVPWLDDGSLAILCIAMGMPFDPVEDAARETDDGPVFSQMLSPLRCPDWALEWLAQFTGQPLQGTDPAVWRIQIAAPSNWHRGSVSAMQAEVALTLTSQDPSQVAVIERVGDENHFTVATFLDDTPDPAATLAAAQRQKPGGLIMDVVQVSRNTYYSQSQDEATYADAAADHSTYADAEAT